MLGFISDTCFFVFGTAHVLLCEVQLLMPRASPILVGTLSRFSFFLGICTAGSSQVRLLVGVLKAVGVGQIPVAKGTGLWFLLKEYADLFSFVLSTCMQFNTWRRRKGLVMNVSQVRCLSQQGGELQVAVPVRPLSFTCRSPCLLFLCAVQQIMDARDVRAAPPLAPAHGLYLAHVAYEGLGKTVSDGHISIQL